ncbi:hypothetical protein [Deinococcus depolymerans]|uniref:Replication protein n=1 Tax=Deinococcus depolymerans TaxID=392408 RepID=A0ABN1CRB7_9DEIO
MTSLGISAANPSHLFSGLQDLHEWDALCPPDDAPTSGLVNRERQRQQFALLDVACTLLPGDSRLQRCHRIRLTTGAPLSVYELPWGPLALQNVQTCGRPYCPLCGPRIRSRRGRELVGFAQALTAQGYRALRVDWTHAHPPGTSMAVQVEQQRHVFQAINRGRRALSQQLRGLGSYVGARRALDYTYGVGGHHLHAHSVLFLKTDAPLEDVMNVVRGAYLHAAQQVGVTVGVAGVHGAWIDPEGARYLHKAGWVRPLTMGSSCSPEQLLLLAGQGDADAGNAWTEYAQGLQGVRTISTTPGLRARAEHALASDGDDAQLAQGTVPQGARLVARLAPSMARLPLFALPAMATSQRPPQPPRLQMRRVRSPLVTTARRLPRNRHSLQQRQ